MNAYLSAPHHVRFAYDRSVGGATERFLRGLAEARIVGSRAPDGTVHVPPRDADPASGRPHDQGVPIAATGAVVAWTWIHEPDQHHPLDQPFAFGYIRLDGADTALLHAIEVANRDEMTTGMRVVADWRPTRTGSIRDVRCFVPAPRMFAGVEHVEAPGQETFTDEIFVRSDPKFDYRFEPGRELSHFYRMLADEQVTGGRCAACVAVYVPPRVRCPVCGSGPLGRVRLGDHGTVESVAVVHLPVPGFDTQLPFAWGWVRLDGADVPFAHLIGGIDPSDVRPGLRVRAVWAPIGQRPKSWEAITYFAPEETP